MLEIPVLGLVENMRGFACPKCGEVTQIFDEGEAERTAEAMKVRHLGHIPLHVSLREGGDTGRPVQAEQPDSAVAERIRGVAEALAIEVSRANFEALREKDLVQIQM
jgi:ATP-binding protein involved in chromosome partitioning